MSEEFKKELVELLKAEGLTLAEESTEKVVSLAFLIIDKVIERSENKYDDMIWAAMKNKLKEFIDEQVNKIDGNAQS